MSYLGWDYLSRQDISTILRGIRAGQAFGGPYHAEIHPAGRCNVACFFCSTASIRKDDQLPLGSFLGIIDDLAELGTRSVRFWAGASLLPPEISLILDRLAEASLPIENLTTNGVLLRARTAEQLLSNCDRITISLNTGDAESYGDMMKTSPKNFDRVLENIRALIAARKKRRPLINLQFLVWRDNYLQIPRMYRLARELEVDSVIFNGLSFLPAEQRMSEEQRTEMLHLYEKVIEEDEFRVVESIESYEKPLANELQVITRRLTEKRAGQGLIGKALRFAGRRDFSLSEKARHWLKMRKLRQVSSETANMVDDCVIGWHSLVIKTSGDVAPCCILQHRSLGNVFQSSVRDVWFGERYQQLRSELRQILVQHEQWEPGNDAIAVPMCAGKSEEACPIKTIYRADIEFSRELDQAAASLPPVETAHQ